MELILTNAKIVTIDSVFEGSLCVDAESIKAVGAKSDVRSAVDCDGDYLIPGLIDIHTDNIEAHFFPRPGVHWPAPLSAIIAHDWQMIGAGITTVLDALSLGDYDQAGSRSAVLSEVIRTLDYARSASLLRSEHFFHFRCEVSDERFPEIVGPHSSHPMVRLVSIMDHTPGQGQWRNLDLFRETRRKKRAQVWNDADFAAYIDECRRRQELYVPQFRKIALQIAADCKVPIASHDDTTVADVERAKSSGISISEFPTTLEAARHARALDMRVVMGSPNIVLKRSHSGNVSALDLAEAGFLDVLSSDYVPSSLLRAAFDLSERIPIAAAIATVTKNPAIAANFDDRGEISPGLRADLLLVRLLPEGPLVRGIWKSGQRVL